jgi:hypothetical protein
MIEASHRASLALEPLSPLGMGGQVSGQNLDGDAPVEPAIAGKIHLAHASCA